MTTDPHTKALEAARKAADAACDQCDGHTCSLEGYRCESHCAGFAITAYLASLKEQGYSLMRIVKTERPPIEICECTDYERCERHRLPLKRMRAAPGEGRLSDRK